MIEAFVMSVGMLEKVKEQMMCLEGRVDRLNGIPVYVYASKVERAELVMRLMNEGTKVLLCESEEHEEPR